MKEIDDLIDLVKGNQKGAMIGIGIILFLWFIYWQREFISALTGVLLVGGALLGSFTEKNYFGKKRRVLKKRYSKAIKLLKEGF